MRKTILIVGTNMMNIYHHRLELIQSLLNKHYKVIVAAPKGGEEKELIKIGCQFIDTPVDNRGKSFKNDISLIGSLIKICRQEKPNVILTFYTKTNIYGGLVARFLKIPYVENITGLGSAFSNKGSLARIMEFLYKNAVRDSYLVFFQNESNRQFFLTHKLYKGKYAMLPGSGVSLERYYELPYPKNNSTEFLFISRIMKEKGIEEYVKSAEILKEKYPEVVFHVVGPCESPYDKLMEEKNKAGIIKYHGKLYDVHDLLSKTHCTVLPSYYPEGMANVLLESAASGRPIITTSLPGCGEAVEHNTTGYIVREKSVESLTEAMERFLLLDINDKEKMGKAGRKKMEKEFDRRVVTHKYISTIEEILSV